MSADSGRYPERDKMDEVLPAALHALFDETQSDEVRTHALQELKNVDLDKWLEETDAIFAEKCAPLAPLAARLQEGLRPSLQISIDEGWWSLALDLNEQLATIDPSYKLIQVKEKFGSLRYYTTHDTLACPGRGEKERCHWDSCPFEQAIRSAEARSARTCETCGDIGVIRAGGWQQSLCDRHAHGRPPLSDE